MFFKLTRIQPGTFFYNIFCGQYVTLYAVSKKYFTESEKALQIKAGQNSASVNRRFSLYFIFFFKPLLFLCRNRNSGRLVLRKTKLFFPPSFFFHSKWPNLTAKRQELGPAILRHRKPRCKNGNVEYIRSKWREIIEVVQYCR